MSKATEQSDGQVVDQELQEAIDEYHRNRAYHEAVCNRELQEQARERDRILRRSMELAKFRVIL